MKIDLNGKTAIVTGSSAGIGWGCARGLAEAGATVVVTARRQDALESGRDRLIDAVPGSTVRAVAADLSSVGGCENLVRAEPGVTSWSTILEFSSLSPSSTSSIRTGSDCSMSTSCPEPVFPAPICRP